MCWCDHAAAAFRTWLRARYGGHSTRSTRRGAPRSGASGTPSWEQVLPPRETQYLPNPGPGRWTSAGSGRTNCSPRYTEQRDALRVPHAGRAGHHELHGARSPGDRPVVVGARGGRRGGRPLPVVRRAAGRGTRTSRSSPTGRAGIGGGRPWLLMEQAPSTVIDSGVLTHRSPGRMHAPTACSTWRGASDGAMFFQWRASRAGAEMYHPALVPHAGADTQDLRARRPHWAPRCRGCRRSPGRSPYPRAPRCMVDAPSHWALQAGGCRHRTSGTWTWPVRCTRSLWRSGVMLRRRRRPMLTCPPTAWWSSPPFTCCLTRRPRRCGRIPRLAGSWLSRSAAGSRTTLTAIWLGGYPGALRDVLGIRVEEFHPLQPAESVALAGDACPDSTWAGRLWAERLRPEGAAVIATYAAGDLAGLPALTRHSFGAGTAWYLSTLLSDDALTTLLGSIAGEACGASPGVARRFRDPPAGRGRAVVAVRVQLRRCPRLGAGLAESTWSPALRSRTCSASLLAATRSSAKNLRLTTDPAVPAPSGPLAGRRRRLSSY